MKPWIKWQDISMKLDIKVETHNNKQQWNQQSVTMKEEANQRWTYYGTES